MYINEYVHIYIYIQNSLIDGLVFKTKRPTQMYIDVYIRIYTCLNIYICMYTYIHTYTCFHMLSCT
jgi:hypothetical protein